MDTESKARLIDIFNAALALKPEDRAALLAETCAGNEPLRREVESLLEHAQPDNSFIAKPAVERYAKDLVGAASLDLIGQQLEHYLITEAVGSGGMGQVYKARDQKLGREVAIKILPLEFTADASLVRRFEQEAQAASALNHPNIITIHEIGQAQAEAGGWQFIVMEYVAGQTLRARLQAGKIAPSEAIEIAAQIADALAAAHTAGILHRDIKPENIMLRRTDGKVKVLDFGIAKLGEERRGDTETRGWGDGGKETSAFRNSPTLPLPHSPTLRLSTALGTVVGTVNYMSPEQARGEPLDGRTDVFSLGQILLEMVRGKSLFAGTRPLEVLELLRSGQEPLTSEDQLAGVPKALAQIIRRSLKRDVQARYASAQEMLADLKQLQRRAATKWLRRSVVSSLIGIVLLFVTLGFAARYSTHEIWEEKILRDGHTAAVRRAAISPNGRLLVSASDDKTVMVWDFVLRKRLKTLNDHAGRVRALAFSADGKWFATGSRDKTVIVWSAVTFEKVTTLREHRDEVNAVAFSPDGKWLASASSADSAAGSDFRTILWETSRWEKAREIPYGVVYGPILFSPDSRLLVTNQVQWDWVSGKLAVSAEAPGAEKWGGWNWAAFSPDAKLLVGTGGAGEIVFRGLSQTADLPSSRLLQKTHAHQDFGRAVAFSPDGKLVATGTDDILLWDSVTRKIVSRFDNVASVWGLAFSPDGRWLVSSHSDGSIQVWDLNERRRTVGFDGHGNQVLAVASSPDGKRIASAGKDGAVILWNVETQQKETVLFGHATRVVNLAFSSDSTWLASFDQDGYLIRWDLEKFVPRWKVLAHSGSACLAISPDGKWLTNTWAIYESSAGRERMRWDEMQAGIKMADATAFSPDGNRVALVGGRKLRVFDTQQWQVIGQQDVNFKLTQISFSPDGQNLVTGGEDGTLIWWETATLEKRAEVKKHKAAVTAAFFSPDGKTIASADKEEIIMWDAASQKRMTTIGPQALPVHSLAFLRAGKQLVVGKRDSSVQVYTRHLMRWGQRLD
jgi:WD40 repeat protein